MWKRDTNCRKEALETVKRRWNLSHKKRNETIREGL